MTEQYEVGYGKPPQHTQFQKGKSGNPKGRPKKEPTTFLDIADYVGNKRVTIYERGRRKKIGLVEASLNKLFADALKGEPYAMRLVVDLFTKHTKLRKDMNDVFMRGLMDRFLTR